MPGSKEPTEGDPAQHGPLPRPGPALCSAFPACCRVPGTLWEQCPVRNRTNKALALPRVSPASLSKSKWQRAMLGFVIRGSAAVSPTHQSRQLHLCLVLALHRPSAQAEPGGGVCRDAGNKAQTSRGGSSSHLCYLIQNPREREWPREVPPYQTDTLLAAQTDTHSPTQHHFKLNRQKP